MARTRRAIRFDGRGVVTVALRASSEDEAGTGAAAAARAPAELLGVIDASPARVALVLHRTNRGWILEKFADRLAEHLGRWGFDPTITDMVAPTADLNHFMMYMHGPERRSGPATVLVTHVDRPHKVYELNGLLRRIDAAICLSRMTVEQLVGFGLPARKLCFVVPGCDQNPEPRRTVIVIAGRLYRDLRKREDLIVKLAHSMRLHNFRFEILGLGWEWVVGELRAAGAHVNHYPPSGDYIADYERILDRLRVADFYFYPGLDEGSMGLMDALAMGVPTISTPQGFHLDIPGGLTHAFWDFPQMLAIFEGLARERQDRVDSMARFSWEEYARRHAVIWRALLNGGDVDFGAMLDTPSHAVPKPPSRSDLARRWAQMFIEEGGRFGSYMWRSVKRQTQPSDARRHKR